MPTRRTFIRTLSATAAVQLLRTPVMSARQLVPALAAVDHLLLGVADLDAGIAWVERRTGVKAAIGGSHPGRGTRNALVSLGGRRYLEIIAPDPAQAEYRSRTDVRGLTTPRLITWAAASTDIAALARRVGGAGLEVSGPSDGSRARPDGKVLKWRTLGLPGRFANGPFDPLPFFIQWEPGSAHPSSDSPTGCDLQGFEIAHPDPDGVSQALRQCGLEAQVARAGDIRLTAILQTPKGRVEVS